MGVLDDHIREGKLFRPPMAQIGPLSEVSWVDDMLPEFLWIALLHEKYGLQLGVDIASQLSRAASESVDIEPSIWFAPLTSFETLDGIQSAKLVEILDQRNILGKIIEALKALLVFYPSCPMGFFIEEADTDSVGESELEDLRALVSKLFDKWARPATLAQANAVYIALETGRLKIMEGITWLEDFESISDYPTSEVSRQVGASVRATCLTLFPMFMQSVQMIWPSRFWNRGLELAPCK